MSGKFKKILPLFLVLILSYWTFKTMLINGYFPMHDDTQPARVFAMSQELEEGIFPVRLVSFLGYGYGYPLFNFYAPLPYYLGSFFYLIGFDLIFATKIMFIVGTVCAGVFMFLLAGYEVGSLFGIVASILYLYAPYHAVNLYVRGAVGEYYAYAFLPLVVLGILKIMHINPKDNRQSAKAIIPGVIGLSGVLLSHNILGLITLYFLGIIFVVLLFLYTTKKISQQKIKFYVFMVLLGFGLSAFFTIPAIAENSFTKVSSLISGSNSYSDHFVTLSQIWDSPWGFAGSTRGLSDGLSFKIGKFHLFSLAASLFFVGFLFINRKIKNKLFFTFSAFLVLFTFSIFMMLSVSAFIYKSVPYLAYVQYPWRFLNFAILAASFMTGYLKLINTRFIRYLTALIILSATIIINGKYFTPKYVGYLDETAYLNSKDISFKASKISDEYLPKDLIIPTTQKEVARIDSRNKKFAINTLLNQTAIKSFEVMTNEQAEFITNIAFFPGWSAKIDGNRTELKNKDGWLSLDVSQGRHIIELEFLNTPVRTASNTISFLSFILLLYFALIESKIWLKNRHLK